jgi:hypothetical protein
VPAASHRSMLLLAFCVFLSTACSVRRTDHQRLASLHWPLLVDQLPDLDTSRVVTTSPNSFRLYRTDISLSFKPEVSDSAKIAFFGRHSMCVIGVTQAGRFFVRIPDPGPTVEALYAVLESLRREPEVARASSIPRDPLRGEN